MIVNQNHPIIVRLATRLTLAKIESDSALPAEARMVYRHVRRLGVLDDVAAGVHDAAMSDNAGADALEAQPTAGGTHPFLDWLAANWKTVYAIAATILAAFGIILPPIP